MNRVHASRILANGQEGGLSLLRPAHDESVAGNLEDSPVAVLNFSHESGSAAAAPAPTATPF